MIHTLRVPCPQCGTLLVDFDGPFDRNWGCLRCSMARDDYGEGKRISDEVVLTPEEELIFQETLDLLDKLFEDDDLFF